MAQRPLRTTAMLPCILMILLLVPEARSQAVGEECGDGYACDAGACCGQIDGGFLCVAALIDPDTGDQLCDCRADKGANGLNCTGSATPFCCPTTGECVSNPADPNAGCPCDSSSDCGDAFGGPSCCLKSADVLANNGDGTGLCNTVASGACRCFRDDDCGSGQCCGSDGACSLTGFNSSGAQVCRDCNAFPEGLACPPSASVCCKNGACAASAAACACLYSTDCRSDECCTRKPRDTAPGTCVKSPFDGQQGGQACPDCRVFNADVSLNGTFCCPGTGQLVASPNDCAPGCPNCACDPNSGDGGLWQCDYGLCCSDQGLCVADIVDPATGAQQCRDCRVAAWHDLECPSAPVSLPVCCQATGRCAGSDAGCSQASVGLPLLSKYQSFHLQFVQFFAISTMAADADMRVDDEGDDNSNFDVLQLDDFFDFRPYVERGATDGGGAPEDQRYCDGRHDYTRDTNGNDDNAPPFRGLDATNAAGPLAYATDVAAQLWYKQCTLLPACSAALASDKVNVTQFKQWTKLSASKVLEYLRQAPGGRNLLCAPKFELGPLFSIINRGPDNTHEFFGRFNYPLTLTPVSLTFTATTGATLTVNPIELQQQADALRGLLPWRALSVESLFELLILHDQTLLPAPTQVLSTTRRAAATSGGGAKPAAASTAAAAGGRRAGALGAAAPAVGGAKTATAPSTSTTKTTGIVAGGAPASTGSSRAPPYPEGPTPPASYRANGFFAGTKRGRARRSGATLAARAGCASGNAACAAAVLLGSTPVAPKTGSSDQTPVVVPRSYAGAAAAVAAGGGSRRALKGAAQLPVTRALGKGKSDYNFQIIPGVEGLCLTNLRVAIDSVAAAFTKCTTIKVQVDQGTALTAASNAGVNGTVGSLVKYAADAAIVAAQATCGDAGACAGLAPFLQLYREASIAFDAVRCAVPLAGKTPVSLWGGGKVLPPVVTQASLAASNACLRVGATVSADFGCQVVSDVRAAFAGAMSCCNASCTAIADCRLFGEDDIPREVIPACA